jgi:hypothetical protein
VAFTLAAIGERGPASAQTMERVQIPSNADEVQLAVEIADGAEVRIGVEIEPVDGVGVVQPSQSRVERIGAGLVVTAAVRADALPDGDYVMRVLRADSTPADVLAIRAFRVVRPDSAARP